MTPVGVAAIAAICIAVLWFSDLSGIVVVQNEYKNWILIILGVLALVGSYYIFYYLLKNYIYRKIKLIYKIIRDSKVSLQADRGDLNLKENILDNVERDVQTWFDEQSSEIEYLKSLENYRKDYIGNVSHELKTPLFAVQGYLHTLSDGAIEDEKIRKKYVKRALSNVERLTTIVSDLDMISKLENKNVAFDIEPFDILKLTNEVIDDLEFQAEEKNIELSVKAGADSPFTVEADRESIRQVFTNLIVNSIKYGKEGGRTRVGFYDMDSYILVEVADNGIGIDPGHHKHLFDRFYRVESSRDRHLGGSGLGLAIVKHIIESHDQTISVRSSPGEGSTFGFTLAKKKKR